MCLLILLNGIAEGYPLLVASNRDEQRSRASSPPGLRVGERRRILAPRDRVAGGTWIGVNDLGHFACLTNLVSAEQVVGERSRGQIPILALDQQDLDAAMQAVQSEVGQARYAGFQLMLADGRDTLVLEHEAGQVNLQRSPGWASVISNEHRLGELEIPGLEALEDPALLLDERLELLAEVLLDQGEQSGHRILKKGGEYGTVSSSLMAIDPASPATLIWRYAKGPPDEARYMNYGNLGRRLLEE
ncbi:MAG: NRDE family protein [Planctomycetota bacterium]|jgi:hypothetical protein